MAKYASSFLTEVIDGTLAYMDNNDIEIDELINYIKAPDFPTGGIIYGYEGVREAFKTGRGRCALKLALKRSRVENVLSFLKFRTKSIRQI
jgi:DNA gyrase subunit A